MEEYGDSFGRLFNHDSVNSFEPVNDEASFSTNYHYAQYYKNTGRTVESNIQRRRDVFVTEHKVKHDAILDEFRDLSALFEEVDDSELEIEDMEVESTYKRYPRKKRIRFKTSMSQWFTDVPDDLADNWLVKFCPKGRRRLIVSDKRITKSFTKFGEYSLQFSSSLPGGGYSRHRCESSGMTVLDCIFHAELKTFFIIDVLVWNSVSFLDCEAELRHTWIRSKYLECPELFEATGIDSFAFNLLFDFVADRQIIESELFQFDSKFLAQCDGLLFYHKEAPYISTDPGLITWLRPFMLPEKLQIRIPIEYEESKPKNYVDFQSYLKGKDLMKNEKQNKKASEERVMLESEVMET